MVATLPPSVDWGPATILDGYDADAIGDLKQSTDGLLYVSGSGTLVRALLGDGLVDQLHLFVFPMLRGSGQRLFDGSGNNRRLALREHTAYPNGVVHLHYAPA